MNITIADNYYSLDFSNYRSFYSRKSISPVGATPNVVTPKETGGCWIARFIHDLLILMNKVEKGDKPLVYSVGGGKRLVAWNSSFFIEPMVTTFSDFSKSCGLGLLYIIFFL